MSADLDPEMYAALNELSKSSSPTSLRFQTRLNESNAMKEDSQRMMQEFHNIMMRNERNNGREDVFGAIREVVSGRVYFDSIEDIIQQVKIKLKGK